MTQVVLQYIACTLIQVLSENRLLHCTRTIIADAILQDLILLGEEEHKNKRSRKIFSAVLTEVPFIYAYIPGYTSRPILIRIFKNSIFVLFVS